MVIGAAKAEIGEILQYTAWFVPKIDNWSINDSFCQGLKITAQHPQIVWDFPSPYLQSPSEFPSRFGVVMLLTYYLTPDYIDLTLKRLDAVRQKGYSVKMAVAWALSLCYIKFPQKTTPSL